MKNLIKVIKKSLVDKAILNLIACAILIYSICLVFAYINLDPKLPKDMNLITLWLIVGPITLIKGLIDVDFNTSTFTSCKSNLYTYVVGKVLSAILAMASCIAFLGLCFWLVSSVSLVAIASFSLKIILFYLPIVLISFLATIAITSCYYYLLTIFTCSLGAIFTERTWSLNINDSMSSLFALEYFPSIVLPHLGVIRQWLFGPILNFGQIDYAWEIGHYIVINLLMVVLIKRKLSNIVNDPWRLQKLESPL